MRLLVTGGAGYIGGVVVAQLVAAGHDVEVLDDLSTGHASALPAVSPCTPGTSPRSRRCSPRRPVSRAYCTSPPRSPAGESVVRPEIYWRTNVVGALPCLDAVRPAGAPAGVQLTARLRQPAQVAPVTETCPPAPTNPYGWTKLAADMAVAHAAAARGLGAVSLRYFNVAGAAFAGRRALGEQHDPETHLIPLALQVAPAHARSCRSSAATTRPATAPACGTTSTSRTWPPHICWPWTHRARAAPDIQPRQWQRLHQPADRRRRTVDHRRTRAGRAGAAAARRSGRAGGQLGTGA